MKFKALLLSALLSLPLAFAASAASAGDYPTRPITLIVPFPAGNVSDTLARMVAEEMAKSMKQPVIVENRVGGSGAVGLSAAARAAPDGYTLVIGTAGNLITAPLLQKAPIFDPVNDFQPITMMAPLPMVLVARPDFPANTLAELLAMARKNPSAVSYGSLGVGSIPHLAMEMLVEQAGVKMLHVPYKGSAQATTDLLGGQVGLIIDTVPPARANINAGKMKALAVTSAERVPMIPDASPVDETAGMQGYDANSWTGLMAPARTPPDVVAKIHDVVAAILGKQEVKDRFLQMGLEVRSSSPETFAAYLRSERKKWKTIIDKVGIELN